MPDKSTRGTDAISAQSFERADGAVGEQLDELHKLNQLIDELLFLSRADAGAIALDFRVMHPSSFIETFAHDAGVLAEHHGCRVQFEHYGNSFIAFDAKWIRQVLLNGLTNALNAAPSGSTIVTRSICSPSGWHIAIEDEGPGLPPELRRRMFDRFTRFHPSKNGDGGSGLGLAICKKIIEMHGGRIYADANPSGQGLQLNFKIPALVTAVVQTLEIDKTSS